MPAKKKAVKKMVKSPAEKARAKKERQAKKLKEYQGYVKNGIKALDKQFGRAKWLPQISIKELDISRSSVCVCGQLFEGYHNAQFDKIKESLDPEETLRDESNATWKSGNMKDSWAKKNGFMLPNSAAEKDWDFLTHIWYVTIFNMKIKAGLLP